MVLCYAETGIEIAQDVCPEGFFGCPIAEPGSLLSLPSNLDDWFTKGFQCFDLQLDLKACGGCPSMHEMYVIHMPTWQVVLAQ